MEKEITVTTQGRTIVDANKLFQNKEVIDFVKSVGEVYRRRDTLRGQEVFRANKNGTSRRRIGPRASVR